MDLKIETMRKRVLHLKGSASRLLGWSASLSDHLTSGGRILSGRLAFGIEIALSSSTFSGRSRVVLHAGPERLQARGFPAYWVETLYHDRFIDEHGYGVPAVENLWPPRPNLSVRAVDWLKVLGWWRISPLLRPFGGTLCDQP